MKNGAINYAGISNVVHPHKSRHEVTFSMESFKYMNLERRPKLFTQIFFKKLKIWKIRNHTEGILTDRSQGKSKHVK